MLGRTAPRRAHPMRGLSRIPAAVVLLAGIAAAMPISAAETPPGPIACVGNPPRQIEDPLGPPCTAWFGDDNGGSTWKGVSGDTITVVLYNDLGISGDMNAAYDAGDEDPVLQTQFQYRNLTRTVKAQLRYFASRFETYAREVRVVAVPSGGGLATVPDQRRGEMLIIDHQYNPFAVVFIGGNAQSAFTLAADRGISSFGTLSEVPREIFIDGAPFIWSMLPDQETQASLSADFICSKLDSGTARFANDPLLAGRTRTFGLMYEQRSQRGPQSEQLAALLQQEFEDRCGRPFDLVRPFMGKQQLAASVAAMKLEGITTLVCYCIPQQSEFDVPAAQGVATALGYQPEWFWDPTSGMDKVIWQRLHGSPVHRGFGSTWYWRQPPLDEQFHYRAFKVTDPEGTPNVRWSFDIYHSFLQLFTAIQMAGPTLDPSHVLTGMSQIAIRNPSYAFVPIGGYEKSKTNPYSFIDTAMGWWWDPSGTEPGGQQSSGCMRVINEGHRASLDEWPPGDQDLFASGDPCTGAPIALLEP